MIRHFLRLIPLIVFASMGCNAPVAPAPDSGSQAIINGEPIGSDEFPATAALLFQGTIVMGEWEMPTTMMMCTATLIAPDVVLSAGHCVDEYGLTMGFGEVLDALYCVSFEEDLRWMAEDPEMNPALPDDAVCSSGFVAHPDFDMAGLTDGPPANNNDLSLIFLDEPIYDRPFAYLPDAEEGEQLFEQMEVDVVGYGMRTAEGGNWWEPPDPDTSYERYWAHTFINELGDYEMQVGSDETTGRKCHGDSGGPTFSQVETDLSVSERVIGVTSRAYSAAEDCNIGGVDMRIDGFLEWIEEAMLQACEDGLRDETECEDPGIRRPPAAEGDDDDTADDDDDAANDDDDEGNDCSCSSDGPGMGSGVMALIFMAALAIFRSGRAR